MTKRNESEERRRMKAEAEEIVRRHRPAEQFDNLLSDVFSIPAGRSRPVDRTYTHNVNGYTFYVEKNATHWEGWFEGEDSIIFHEDTKRDLVNELSMDASRRKAK